MRGKGPVAAVYDRRLYSLLRAKTGGHRPPLHVWPVHLKGPASLLQLFHSFLSTEELERAARLRFDHLRDRYVLSHGALHVLLARQLGIKPAEIRFRYGTRGKPNLQPEQRVTFNMSHSGEFALFALTSGCDVGVDVERIRPIENLAGIANRFFCRQETAELMSIASAESAKAFFLCWTRKEAYIKALGEGLHVPLDSFCVTLLPGSDARLIYSHREGPSANRWNLHNFEFDSEYAAALAYAGPRRPISWCPPVTPSELLEMQ